MAEVSRGAVGSWPVLAFVSISLTGSWLISRGLRGRGLGLGLGAVTGAGIASVPELVAPVAEDSIELDIELVVELVDARVESVWLLPVETWESGGDEMEEGTVEALWLCDGVS